MNVMINVFNKHTGERIDTFSCWNEGQTGERWMKVIRFSFDMRAWSFGMNIETCDCRFVPA